MIAADVYDTAADLIEHYGIRSATNGSRHLAHGGHWDRNRPGLSCTSAIQIAYVTTAPKGDTAYAYLRHFERITGLSVLDADAGRTTPAKVGALLRSCATDTRGESA